MASSRLGLLLLLLLLLLTAHPGPSRAQHWSYGWYPGGKRASSSLQDLPSALRPSAGNPTQAAHSLPNDVLAAPEDPMPWEGRTMARWSLQRNQRLV
ncbi:progonadoliberin-2 [Sciurus carolinensis]|uniref:progonadoliberin-2 n=1 Tax=Sciurus carolinensis TaxID=30640 RepID=UPI001FB2D662|nr:progonadoliberin-2 [Sciurus carolinensis]XP_047397805.1 progonadoliberin-2 [Sciurus carolinensis]